MRDARPIAFLALVLGLAAGAGQARPHVDGLVPAPQASWGVQPVRVAQAGETGAIEMSIRPRPRPG
ncbi:hypothetical protein, partial [Roseobacter sp. HKCCA0434]|uniref:hypothetical protein n=1 Tax=Roseobacter sp. HKCCA0434 TaxID=3079297 RepID=UPI002905C94D